MLPHKIIDSQLHAIKNFHEMNLCMKHDERITYHVNVRQWKVHRSQFNCIFFGTFVSQKANFHTAQNRLSDNDALENQVVGGI